MPNDETPQPTATDDENGPRRPAFVHTTAAVQALRQSAEQQTTIAELAAREAVLRAIVPCLDRLERGLDASLLDCAVDIALAADELLDLLGRHGVTRFHVEPGEPFDPLNHDAIDVVASPTIVTGHVVRQHAPGYLLAGRLMRSALVVVAGPSLRRTEGNA